MTKKQVEIKDEHLEDVVGGNDSERKELENGFPVPQKIKLIENGI